MIVLFLGILLIGCCYVSIRLLVLLFIYLLQGWCILACWGIVDLEVEGFLIVRDTDFVDLWILFRVLLHLY